MIDGFCQHKDKNGIKCPDLKCESLTYNFDIFLEHTSKLLSHDEILSLYNEVGEFSIKSENEQYDILIIEDDLATIRLLTSYFERERYICKSVRNGVESLKQLEISQPKVILLDLTLPDMDWYDVALQIKADPSIRDIPLFLFGEITEEDINAKVVELGLFGFIPKPFCLADFKKLLEYASKSGVNN